jgi:hypothetical protein
MAPKAAAVAAPTIKLDVPTALATLTGPQPLADPEALRQAFTILIGMNLSQLAEDPDAVVHIITAVVPFLQSLDASASSQAFKLLGRLAAEDQIAKAWHRPVALKVPLSARCFRCCGANSCVVRGD